MISRAVLDIQKSKTKNLELKIITCEMKTVLDGRNGR